MSNVNTEELVTVYIALRDERARLKSEYEDADKKLVEDMGQLEQALLEVCKAINADSIKTAVGTVIRKVNERFYCNDWENFKDYVLEQGIIDLLERRIHQGNFKQHLKDTKADGLPPGVNVMREFGITVRKSSKE
jgi:hypothetical protein